MHPLHMTDDFNKSRGEGFCLGKESDRRSLSSWFRIFAPAVIGASGELSTMCLGLPSVRYNEVFMLLSCCYLAYPYYQTHYLQKMLKDLMRLELWWSLSRQLLGVEDVTYERHSNYHYLFLQIRDEYYRYCLDSCLFLFQLS